MNENATRGRGNKRKGADIERQIVRLLQDHGVAASKDSRTGYMGHDLLIGDEFLAEVKFRQNEGGWKTLERWLAGVKLLFLRKPQDTKPLVVMDFDTFVLLMRR